MAEVNKSTFESYLSDLTQVASRGDAREESYYPALSSFLENAAAELDRDSIHVTVLPAQTEAGNPDARVWDGQQHVTGYLEAKKPGAPLDEIKESEQLRRYRETFPNLILTDFIEFRLFRDGDEVLDGELSTSRDLLDSPVGVTTDGPRDVNGLLDTFFRFSLPRSYDAESLAVALAKRTRQLRDVVHKLLKEEIEADDGDLLGFYEAFQEYLIAGLSPQDFADLYAQTLTYGLFAARIRAGRDFNRGTAADHIPRSIGILHEIFEFISYGRVPEPLEWMVDDIAEVLAVADAAAILDRYYREGKGTDPVVHFYETFLAEYDPEERERRGVFYTPDPVVSYIVRSLHHLLKERFGKRDGLASDGVTLLDPAAGTMTFVARATREAVDEYVGKYGEGAAEGFLTDHVLENFYAFELMMAPYAIGHLKMSFLLEELGHRLGDDERFQLYLTNTLEMEELEQTRLPGLKSLARESHLAGEVKKETPILVILGNPPYSGHSANNKKWISNLIDDYKEVDGNPLGDRTTKWLQDDYVKFLRFAEWKIDRQGGGLVGMITNHSWLDNPTFRGMRWHLLQTFDEIWVLDLHGNSLRRETTPSGGRDENVFDIRQGVAISCFVKEQELTEDQPATVRHADLWGLREEKYAWLEEHDVATTDWSQVEPKSEFYVYVPRDQDVLERYNEFPRITEVCPLHGAGMTTARDDFVIDHDRNALFKRIRDFRDSSESDAGLHDTFDIREKDGWDIRDAWNGLQELTDEDLRNLIVRVQYRPFDRRWIFYHDSLVWRTVKRIMSHMLAGRNMALITARSNKSPSQDQFFFTDTIVETKCGESTTQSYTIPLYLYSDSTGNDLFATLDDAPEQRVNFHSQLLPVLEEAHGYEPSPEDVFHYIYAVFYAYSYREKYADFLKIDFPRIPFTANPALFDRLAALGKRLTQLHLLESDEVESPVAQFHGDGDNEVARLKSQGFRYDADRERKYINKDQYFAPIPVHLWEYQIGGYQVLRKWLKDRKERRLSPQDIRTYCRIVTAIQKTVEVQEEIDALYPEVEAEVVDLSMLGEA